MDQSIATSPRPSPPFHGGEGVGDSLRQCERCLRFFRVDFAMAQAVIVPASVVLEQKAFPELALCQLPDCAAVAAEIAAAELAKVNSSLVAVARQRVAIRRKVLERRCKKSKHRTSNAERRTSKGASETPGGAQPAVPGWSSCPRDTEPLSEVDSDELMVDRGNSELSTINSQLSTVVGSSQAEFHGAVDVKPAVNKLLLYFHEHPDVWIPMTKLEEIAGAHAVHSRIVEVRAALKPDLDIDQENRFYAPTGTVHSHYRLCLKTESVRLKRAAERVQDARQGTLTTNEH